MSEEKKNNLAASSARLKHILDTTLKLIEQGVSAKDLKDPEFKEAVKIALDNPKVVLRKKMFKKVSKD